MSGWSELAKQARAVLASGEVGDALAGRLGAVLAGAELTFGERAAYDELSAAHKCMALRYALTRGLKHGAQWVDEDVRGSGDLALAAWMDRDLAAFGAAADGPGRVAGLTLSLGWGWPATVAEIGAWVGGIGATEGQRDALLEEAIRESPVLDVEGKVALCRQVSAASVRLRCWFDMAVATPGQRTPSGVDWAEEALEAAAQLADDEYVIDRHFWLMAVDVDNAEAHWERGLEALEACDGVLGDIAALRNALYACAVTSEPRWVQVTRIIAVKPQIQELPERRDGLLYDAVYSTRYATTDASGEALNRRAAKVPKKMTSPLMAASAMALLAAREHEQGGSPTGWLGGIGEKLGDASEERGAAMVLSKVSGLCAGASQSWCSEMAPKVWSAGARTMWLISAMTPRRFLRETAAE